jgi:hypothetical protein
MKASMKKLNQAGSILQAVLIASLSVLLVAALSFGLWAFSSRQGYKTDVDGKIAVAVKAARADEDTIKDAQFVEDEKQPLKSYKGPAAYGTIGLQYPKTWSAYVLEGGGDGPLSAYLNPDFVPFVDGRNTFALRMQVTQNSYDQEVATYESQSTGGSVTVQPFRLDQVPSALGVMIKGKVNANVNGVMVVLPVRDKALKIWTEGTAHVDDFTKIILPNLTYIP